MSIPQRLEHESVARLRARCMALPAMLEDTLALPLPSLVPARHDRIVITATGLAEGPARLLAALWRTELGLCARFEPLTSFLLAVPPPHTLLILFSQGLSPNARIVLEHASRSKRAMLISSCTAGELAACEVNGQLFQRFAEGVGEVWTLAPSSEEGFLLRVQGPTVASLAAMRWTQALGGLAGVEVERAPMAYASAYERAPLHSSALLAAPNLALLTAGLCDDRAHAPRWKLLEGMWRQAPQRFDILQAVHGAWQGFYHEPMALLALVEASCAVQAALVERMRAMLKPHHLLEVLSAEHRGVLALLEYGAQLDAMLCHALGMLGRDLTRWPGHSEDGPLYGISSSAELAG